MKKSLGFALLAGVLAITGCAQYERVKDKLSNDSSTPQVSVKDGQLDIQPAALYFHASEKDVKITWKLPAGANLRFAKERGVVIDGELLDKVIRGTPNSVALDARQNEIVNCEISADALAYTCLNRNTRPGIYNYTVRVQSGDKLLEKDPPIVNMR